MDLLAKELQIYWKQNNKNQEGKVIEKIVRAMMNLIACEVCGKELDAQIFSLSDQELARLYQLSKTHDLAHLTGDALIKNGVIQNAEIKTKLEKQRMLAVYRYEKFSYGLTKLCGALEQAEIPFIPLKGSVLRQYYPEPWMRTRCDIDVLVHEEDLQRVVSYLSDNLGYRRESQNFHDISMFTQGGVHIEVNYDLVEDGKVNSAVSVLKKVWDTAVQSDNGSYYYEMPDEYFYFYHIAHMAKHFVGTGGCGIRPFLDLWILNNRINFDREKRANLLSDGGLDVFAKQAELLAEIWFGYAEHTEITKQMENYILRGGVYGTNANRIAVQQQKKGGKVKYALSKIFIPYKVIKFHYPILQKNKWLTPIMEVRRWGKLIFCGHLKRTVKELKYNSAISENAAAQTQALLKNVGL